MSKATGIHVLLIGIDNYSSDVNHQRYDTNGEEMKFPNLKGAVNDVLYVEQYLLGPGRVPGSSITKLLAPLQGQEGPVAWVKPTYKAIMSSLQNILDSAEPGDRVYVHYSGHGARATTVFPGIKESVWDEALVPSDIRSGGQFIRDLELGLLFHKMANKGLLLTVVLDCCYSGGGIRGDSSPDSGSRAVEGYYHSIQENDTPALKDEIIAHKSFMTVEASGYSFMAACMPNEEAKEYQLPKGGWSGMFTYALVESLKHYLSEIPSPEAIWDCVCARIRDENYIQTPRFMGETRRFFFGQDINCRAPTLIIQRLRQGRTRVGSEVELSGGLSHGIIRGSEYAVIPFGATQVPQDPVVLSVDRVSEDMTVAKIVSFGRSDVTNDGTRGVRLGCQVALVRLPYQMRCRVVFAIEGGGSDAQHDRFREAWHASGGDGDFLTLVSSCERRGQSNGDDDKADTNIRSEFHVILNSQGNYEIRTGQGALLPAIQACLSDLYQDDEDAMEDLIWRLRHLARFRAVKTISNPDGASRLRGQVSFEVYKCGTGSRSERHLDRTDGGELVVKDQDTVEFVIQNRSELNLRFAVLNLDPLYGITQLYPHTGSVQHINASHHGEPGKYSFGPNKLTVPVEFMKLETNRSPTCVDVFKLFITTHGSDFRNLTMRDITFRGHSGTNARGAAEETIHDDGDGGLASLLTMMGGSRTGEYVGPLGDWQAMEIRIRTEMRM